MATIPSPSWAMRFIQLAEIFASYSKDPSTKVGAVAISPDRRIIIPGYNGFPAALQDLPSRLENRDQRLKFTVHAEENVLITLRSLLPPTSPSIKGWTLFTTHHPCSKCALALLNSPIDTVIYSTSPSTADFELRWREDLSVSSDILEEGNIGLFSAQLEPRSLLITDRHNPDHFYAHPLTPNH